MRMEHKSAKLAVKDTVNDKVSGRDTVLDDALRDNIGKMLKDGVKDMFNNLDSS